jgi:hypothetical protein
MLVPTMTPAALSETPTVEVHPLYLSHGDATSSPFDRSHGGAKPGSHHVGSPPSITPRMGQPSQQQVLDHLIDQAIYAYESSSNWGEFASKCR